MPFVLDGSIAVSWFFNDEVTPETAAVRDGPRPRNWRCGIAFRHTTPLTSELATRTALPLATLDAALANAARAERVQVIGPLAARR